MASVLNISQSETLTLDVRSNRDFSRHFLKKDGSYKINYHT